MCIRDSFLTVAEVDLTSSGSLGAFVEGTPISLMIFSSVSALLGMVCSLLGIFTGLSGSKLLFEVVLLRSGTELRLVVPLFFIST